MKNPDRHIWEGWTVRDFVLDLEPLFERTTFNSRKEVIDWCKANQPYYKKHIKEVADYFIKKANL